MKLNNIQTLVLIFCRCHRTVRCMSCHSKSGRHPGNIIKMAHPAYCIGMHSCKQRRLCIYCHFRFPIFPNRRFFHLSPQYMHHKLRPIAQTEYRNPKFKQLLTACGRIRFIAAAGTSCQNNSFRVHRPDLLQVCPVGKNLTIYVTFSNTSGNKLIVLTAKVNYNYFLLIHFQSPPTVNSVSFLQISPSSAKLVPS